TGAILIDQADSTQPQDHVIYGNTVKNTAGYGIRVADLDTGTIVANVIRNYDTTLAARKGISLIVAESTCKNIVVVGNNVTGGGGAGGVTGGGVPIAIETGCTRILCVGNVCQENGAHLFTDTIDNDAASTIHAFNCDDQRTTRLFESASGMTPVGGMGALGRSDNGRKMAYEVTVAAGAAAGHTATVSSIANNVTVIN